MNLTLEDAKLFVDTLLQSGKATADVAEAVNDINLNGDMEALLNYIHERQLGKVTDYNRTDAGNAEYFNHQHGDSLRFDHRRTRWLEWYRHYWREDTDGQVLRLALRATRDRFRQSTAIEDLKEREKVVNWAMGSEQRARLEACIAIAKNLYPIADSGEDWDVNPWLLCCQNGVIDLQTGEISNGDPTDRITQHSPVEFNREAKPSRWLEFLDEIFSGDQSLIEWLQRFMGYTLTGDTREQVVAVCYGSGANGKGRLLSTMRHIMGDYSFDAPFSTFELANRSAIPNDLAALQNRRLVTSSETNQGTRLNEARIKALTGQDPVTARFLHCEFFTFQPVAKFWLAVNHRPRVYDDTYGFWRRVRLIPFNREFRGEADDKELLHKLISEASGILNWLLDGCLQWQRQGLDPTPDSVLVATQEYQSESDPLSEFVLDECAISTQARVKANELYKSYLKWCDSQGLREKEKLTNTAFGRRMGQKFKKSHDRDGTFYRGIGLRCDGFVTGFERSITENELVENLEISCGNKQENSSQPLTTFKNPSRENGELPDCPNCGKNEWSYSPTGDRICPCGYKETVA